MTPTEVRREFLIRTRAYDEEIADALLELQLDIERAAQEYPNDPDGFTTAVSLLIVGFYTAFTAMSVNVTRDVALVYANYVDKTIITMLNDVGATNTARSLRDKAIKYPTVATNRFKSRINPYDRKTFDQRIVTLKRASDDIVKQLVARGIKDGKSVNDIARSIQNYVDPTSQAGRRWTRGNGINYKALPPNRRLPKAAIRYNAVRIARSEIMQTYQQSTGEFYDDQPYNQGFRWVLSNTHTGKDICDINAARIYKRYEDIPKRHPQCMCDIQPIPITLAQLRRLVSSGAID
jgi:hypothetical protein